MKVNEHIKKIISLILVFLLVAPFWITYSSLQFQKYAVKKEIKKFIVAGIDKSELILLKFTKQATERELRWEHSKEFEYKGCMYDIIKTEVKNDSVYYWCWQDSEETELNNRLKSLVTKAVEGNHNSKDQVKRIVNFFSTLTHTNFNPFNLLVNHKSTLYDYNHSIIYPYNIKEINTPPPKTVFS